MGQGVIESEAIAECQVFAVLLHRIDEELLYGDVIHSNTSLGKVVRINRKMNFLPSKLARDRGGLALKCGYYSTRFGRKKVG